MFQTKQAFDVQAMVTDLLAQNRTLTDSNAKFAVALDESLHELKRYREKCEELAAHIKKMQEVPTQFASGPLWMSEEEEDARYRHEQGNLNGEGLRTALAELGLDPEIIISDE